jgi:hypothetical protein
MELVKFSHRKHRGNRDQTEECQRSEIVHKNIKQRKKDRGGEDATNGFR